MREFCTYPLLPLHHQSTVVSAEQMKYLDSKFCCSTMLEPVPNTILKPGKFDNTDYSQKQSLEVQSIVRDFANALHPNNLSHTKEVIAPTV